MNKRCLLIVVLIGLVIADSCMAVVGREDSMPVTDYELIYEVFVGNGDLYDALHVAEKALSEDTDNILWRRRLARVADWTQNPGLAYQNWKFLYVQNLRDEEVISAMERLAAYANDYSIVIDLLRTNPDYQPISDERWHKLADLYDIAAIPLIGARQLEKDFYKLGNTLLGELAARLYSNAGADNDAERLYLALANKKYSTPKFIKKAAQLRIGKDDLSGAYDLLNKFSNEVSDDDYDYWQLLGSVAWMLQEDETALVAYQRSAALPDAKPQDFDRLFLLILAQDPMNAAVQAEQLYRHTEKLDWIERAIIIYSNTRNYSDAQQLLDSLDNDTLARLETHPHFLIARSNILEKSGNINGAIDDIKVVLTLDPNNIEAHLNAIWLFIAYDQFQSLRNLIVRLGMSVNEDERYWFAIASAYQVLGDRRMAARFYRLKLQQEPNNPLLLLTYADAMEQLDQIASARRLRSHALHILLESNLLHDMESDQSIAFVNLTLYQSSGDVMAAVLRHVSVYLREMQGRSSELDPILLHWALDHEDLDNARALMVNRIAHNGLPTPVWARLQLALIADDQAELIQLLTEHEDELSSGSKYYAYNQLGAKEKALETAYDTLTIDPDNEEMHVHYSGDVTALAHRLRFDSSFKWYETFKQRLASVITDLHVRDDLRLQMGYSINKQASRNYNTLPFVPSKDIRRFARVEWETKNRRLSVGGFTHSELGSFTGWHLGYGLDVIRRLNIAVEVNVHAPADESIALMLGGMEDRFAIGARYNPERNLLISVKHSLTRYMTQFGSDLGVGGRLDWDIGYNLRNAYPNWNMRISGSHARYKVDGSPQDGSLSLFNTHVVNSNPKMNAVLFMPGNVDFYSFCSGVGQSIGDEQLTYLWRPLADVCATTYGNNYGYNALFGIAGPVFGGDQLRAAVNVGQGGISPESDQTIFLNISYQHYL